MKIEVLYVPGCPNYHPAVETVTKVLKLECLHTEIRPVPVHNKEEAAALRFPGSPTVRVNGQDVEPQSGTVTGLSCRLYENGLGVPSEAAIRRSVLRAQLED